MMYIEQKTSITVKNKTKIPGFQLTTETAPSRASYITFKSCTSMRTPKITIIKYKKTCKPLTRQTFIIQLKNINKYCLLTKQQRPLAYSSSHSA